MSSEIDLLETENLGSIVTIIAFLIFVSSAFMSIKMELSRLNGADLKISPSPSEVTVTGSLVYALGSYVLLVVSLERIEQRKEQLQSGTASGTLLPNIWISISTVLTFLSALALIKGSHLRVLEQGQITII
jgi:hypothetical protein